MTETRPSSSLGWLDRAMILGAAGLAHAGVLGFGALSFADPPPVATLREVEIVSAEELGLETNAAKPAAVPTALPAPEAAPAAPPPAPAAAPPQDEALKPVAGQDPALAAVETSPEAAPEAAPATEAAPSAPAAAEAAEPPAAPSREVLIEYAALVSQAINRLKYYPEAARHDRNTGVVEVAFRLDGSGAVLAAEVAKSSGSAALDAAALQMIRAAELPPPPNGRFKGRIAIDFRILP